MDDKIKQQLAALARSFADQVPGRLAALAEQMARLDDAARAGAAIDEIRAQAHKLAGSGATFGLAGVSTAARELEQLCDPVAVGDRPVDAAFKEDAKAAFAALEQAAAAPDAAAGGKPAAVPAGPAADQSAKRPSRVLIVDDDPSISRFCDVVLKKAGVEVRTVADPLEAVPAVGEFRPEAVILDLQMPGRSGVELSADLRAIPEFANLPILFLSGDGDTARQAAADVPRAGHVTKPVRGPALLAALGDVLAKDG